MRLPKILLTFLIFCTSVTYAQTELFTQVNGKWKFTQYAADIIKLTFTPDNYISNENISDAVILKPMTKLNISAVVKNNAAVVKNKNLAVNITPAKIDNYYGFDISLANNEKIYGGGERALPLNRRGYKFNLYNSPHYGYGEGSENLNYSVPFFTSSNGYGIFFDNASKGYADIGKTKADIFQAGFVSGELNVYLIFGKDNKEILANYYKLTGTQPLPPRWAFGNLMSRFGYTSQQEANEIVAKMRAENIPVDAIIFDLFWFGDSIQNTLGNLAWVNKKKWPDPKKMISDFKKKNINTILITEPYVLKSSSNYTNTTQYHAVDSAGKPFVLTNFYFGKGGLLDIFKKDAQKWFWSKHKEQMKIGVEGWWGDLGEPETHPADMYHNLKDLGHSRLFKADEVHNIYGHTWTKMLFNQFAKEYPTKRLFSLNRSGFAGSQRFGIFPWTGDVSRSWSGLRAQLPVILGMSMSGVPYVHSDAGGFAGGEGDNELYIRWLQFAAFTPIFRPHGTALGEVDKNAFSFPSEAALIEEPYRSYAKEIIQLRYSLLPYNYTLAYNQATKGSPLIAPLYYYYPKDTAAVNVSDEFMWGENILVAPFLNKGIDYREVYLPKGTWYKLTDVRYPYDFGTYEGTVSQNVSLKEMAVFVKAGSFIPMIIKDNGVNSALYTTDSLIVNYYQDSKYSEYTLYDDNGNSSNSISAKQFELLNFTANPSANKLSFLIKSNGGKFATKPAKRNIKLIVHGKANVKKKVYVDGKKGEIVYPFIGRETGPVDYYYINFTFTGKSVRVEIK